MAAVQWLPQNLLAGKTAFITGGGSGINLGIACAYAALGANVAICGRSQAKLDQAAELLRNCGTHRRVLARAADVRVPEQLEMSFAACRDPRTDRYPGLWRRRKFSGRRASIVAERFQDRHRH